MDLVLFPFVILALFVLTTAVSMLLSSLYVRFRDTAIIWSVVSTASSTRPRCSIRSKGCHQYRDLILLNPLTPMFEQTRKWLIDPGAPGAVSAAGGWTHLLPSLVLFVGICVLGAWYFNRAAPRIAEEL